MAKATFPKEKGNGAWGEISLKTKEVHPDMPEQEITFYSRGVTIHGTLISHENLKVGEKRPAFVREAPP